MDTTVSQRLEALSKLQGLDSKLNEIGKVRGALPEEVGDLEDEVAGYETRIQNYKPGPGGSKSKYCSEQNRNQRS